MDILILATNDKNRKKWTKIFDDFNLIKIFLFPINHATIIKIIAGFRSNITTIDKEWKKNNSSTHEKFQFFFWQHQRKKNCEKIKMEKKCGK